MVRTWTMALLTAGGLAGFGLISSQVSADEGEAIIRISDCAENHGGAAGSCPNGNCPNGAPVAGCPSCRSGFCQSHGSGYAYTGTCIRPGGHVHQFLDWFNPHGMCVHSPDHGWAPPGKMHTPHPQQVAYRKSFPDAWSGQPGVGVVGGPRPVQIYTPTDTTQLGYYYQAVPRWHAYRGMVPGVPDPRQWHRDLCQGKGAPGCKNCQNGQAAVGQGEQIIEEKVIENPQPQQADPQPHPAVEPNVAPPPPADPKPALEKAETPNLQRIN